MTTYNHTLCRFLKNKESHRCLRPPTALIWLLVASEFPQSSKQCSKGKDFRPSIQSHNLKQLKKREDFADCFEKCKRYCDKCVRYKRTNKGALTKKLTSVILIPTSAGNISSSSGIWIELVSTAKKNKWNI